MKKTTLIVITGPTASGKSALAVDIAERMNTEIISADSRQIYTGIPIVTAMPSDDERSRVRHHLIDFLPLEAYYSASMYEQDALGILSALLRDKRVAVVCGGSMMYVDALCNGIDDLPTVPEYIRNGLKLQLEQQGQEWLLSELARLDPEYYEQVDHKNTKRVFHAVEIILASGKTYTSLRQGKKVDRPFDIIKLCLDIPREELFNRINLRVDMMVSMGLEEEARKVYDKRHLNALNTVGLKEMFAYFEGKMDRHEAIERIKKNTRVYAKKQMTWWKRDPRIIQVNPFDSITIDNLIRSLENHS